MKVGTTLIIALILIACHGIKNDSKVILHDLPECDSLTDKVKRKIVLDSSIGVLVLSSIKEDNTVKLYDKEGKKKIEIGFYDNSKPEYKRIPNYFHPWAFSMEYFILNFKVLEDNPEFYKIEINDSMTWYYSKKDSLMNFYTWDKFVLNGNFVSITQFGEKIYKEKTETSENINPEIKNTNPDFLFLYHPVAIDKYWLKIKWEDSGGEEHFGYVKWRNDSCLLIKFLYAV